MEMAILWDDCTIKAEFCFGIRAILAVFTRRIHNTGRSKLSPNRRKRSHGPFHRPVRLHQAAESSVYDQRNDAMKTILAADDSPSIRQMVAFTLSEAGYTVVQAGDGVDGLAKARTSNADGFVRHAGAYSVA
jgi:hypothetical protein